MQPTPFQLLRRAEALGIDIKLGTDPKTGKLVWDATHDLTAAVDALAVHEGELPAPGGRGKAVRHGPAGDVGGVFPISTVLARLVATSLP